MDRYVRPDGLDRLIDHHKGGDQVAASYNPNVWVSALAGVVSEDFVRSALQSQVAAELSADRWAVDRNQVAVAVAGADLDDDDDLLSAWLLVQAWGNGVRSQFGRQNTAKALGHRDLLVTNLRDTAAILRATIDPSGIESAYRAWRGRIGINESFFTKWFGFAGVSEGRSWQPLILDRRVWRTLNKTLGLSVREIAGTTSQWVVYRTYVELVHEWAGSVEGAQRLEWVLFEHNGRALPCIEA